MKLNVNDGFLLNRYFCRFYKIIVQIISKDCIFIEGVYLTSMYLHEPFSVRVPIVLMQHPAVEILVEASVILAWIGTCMMCWTTNILSLGDIFIFTILAKKNVDFGILILWGHMTHYIKVHVGTCTVAQKNLVELPLIFFIAWHFV